MKVISGVAFRQYHVSFHFIRETIWHPWKSIGAYATCQSKGARSKYIPEYKHVERAFKREADRVRRFSVAGSREFLELWRRENQDIDSVMCPVINYFTSVKELSHVLRDLYNYYVASDHPRIFAKLAIMIMERDAFFPERFGWKRFQGDRVEILKAAGYA